MPNAKTNRGRPKKKKRGSKGRKESTYERKNPKRVLKRKNSQTQREIRAKKKQNLNEPKDLISVARPDVRILSSASSTEEPNK